MLIGSLLMRLAHLGPQLSGREYLDRRAVAQDVHEELLVHRIRDLEQIGAIGLEPAALVGMPALRSHPSSAVCAEAQLCPVTRLSAKNAIARHQIFLQRLSAHLLGRSTNWGG